MDTDMIHIYKREYSVQFKFSCSVMSYSLQPHELQHAMASLSMTNSQSPPKPMSIESVMPSNHFILCRPLLLLPSIFPSIRVFPNEWALHIRWPKYWSFRFSPSNEYSGLISFRMDWLDLLTVQDTPGKSVPSGGFRVSTNYYYPCFRDGDSEGEWG